MSISVMGVPGDGMGGLKESIKAFRKHQADTSDALLNISGIGLDSPVDKDEPRPGYVYQPFPKMIYHADGRYEIVQNKAEMDEFIKNKGFREKPYPRQEKPVSADPVVERKMLEDQNAELRAKIAKSAELQEKLMARIEALEKK